MLQSVGLTKEEQKPAENQSKQTLDEEKEHE